MSDIPAAREILSGLAPQLAPEHRAVIEGVLPLLWRRRPAKPRAPVTSAKVGPEEADAIRAFAQAFPRMSEVQIARRFRTNPGRVSEALHGLR